MDTIDFDKIRAMPPDRKVKALQELQGKLGEFIRERAKEIDQSQREIKDAQDFLKEAEDELRVLEEMQEQAPGIKKVDVEKLFEQEKKSAGKPGKSGDLEAIADTAPRTNAPSAVDNRAYVSTLARQPITTLYERINTLRDDIRNTGVITTYQQEKLEQFREALHEKEDAIKAGEYAAGRKAEHMLSAAEKAVMYASGNKQDFYKNN